MPIIYVKFCRMQEPKNTGMFTWGTTTEQLNPADIETVRIEINQGFHYSTSIEKNRLLLEIGNSTRKLLEKQLQRDVNLILRLPANASGLPGIRYFDGQVEKDGYKINPNLALDGMIDVKKHTNESNPIYIEALDAVFNLILLLKTKPDLYTEFDQYLQPVDPSVNEAELELLADSAKPFDKQVNHLLTTLDTIYNNKAAHKEKSYFPHEMLTAAFQVHDAIRDHIKHQENFDALPKEEKIQYQKLVTLTQKVVDDFPTCSDPKFKEGYGKTLNDLLLVAELVEGHRSKKKLIWGAVLCLVGAALLATVIVSSIVSMGALTLPNLFLLTLAAECFSAVASWMGVALFTGIGVTLGLGALGGGSFLLYSGMQKGPAEAAVKLASTARHEQHIRLN